MRATDAIKITIQQVQAPGDPPIIVESTVCPRCLTEVSDVLPPAQNGGLYRRHNHPLPNGHWMIPLVGTNCPFGEGETDPSGTLYDF